LDTAAAAAAAVEAAEAAVPAMRGDCAFAGVVCGGCLRPRDGDDVDEVGELGDAGANGASGGRSPAAPLVPPRLDGELDRVPRSRDPAPLRPALAPRAGPNVGKPSMADAMPCAMV